MPFESVTNLPDVEPAVRVFFSGLMVVEPTGNKACEVFVHRSASAHHLTIEVRRKTRNRPDEIMMRHVGPLAFVGPDDPQNPPIHGLLIEKITDGEKGVKRYIGKTTGSNGEETLGLAIDMAGPDFHGENVDVAPDLVTNKPRKLLDIDPLASRPSIFLDDGVFHTAAKTREGLKINLKQRNKNDKELEPFASLIGNNLYLDDGESVVLIWRNQGKLARLELKKPDPDVSYEIYIANDPLFESDSISDPELDPKHDEFAEYYKVFTAVPTDQQFRLEVKPKNPQGPPVEKGSTMIPCMTVTKDAGGG